MTCWPPSANLKPRSARHRECCRPKCNDCGKRQRKEPCTTVRFFSHLPLQEFMDCDRRFPSSRCPNNRTHGRQPGVRQRRLSSRQPVRRSPGFSRPIAPHLTLRNFGKTVSGTCPFSGIPVTRLHGSVAVVEREQDPRDSGGVEKFRNEWLCSSKYRRQTGGLCPASLFSPALMETVPYHAFCMVATFLRQTRQQQQFYD